MTNYRNASIAGLMLVAGAAHAGSYSLTPLIATDYDFRGFSQTDPVDQDGKPAFQLGATYDFDSGFYAGAWGSNVDNSFGTLDGDNFEIDLYGGYAWGDASSSFAYDVGLNFYTYPGLSSWNTLEAFVGVSRETYSAKLWYSPDVASSSDSGFYAELNGNLPLGGSGVSLLLHAGTAFGQAYGEPWDFSFGTGYKVGMLDLAIKYVDGTKSIEGRLIGSVSTTLPW